MFGKALEQRFELSHREVTTEGLRIGLFESGNFAILEWKRLGGILTFFSYSCWLNCSIEMDYPKRRPLGEKNKKSEEKQVTQVRSHIPDHEDKENLESSPLTSSSRSICTSILVT